MDPSAIFAITRPQPALWTYYVLKALATGPGMFVAFPVLYFRYHTMKYRFDEQGISMQWGILFRNQTVLNYARIQDVHLKSNLIERYLGLARIQIETASGSGSADIMLEGIPDHNAMRDFLYSRMRGVKDHPTAPAAANPTDATLREIAAELRAIREHLERRNV